MNPLCVLGRVFPSALLSRILGTAILLAMPAWTSLAFCDDIFSAAQTNDVEQVRLLLKNNHQLAFATDRYNKTALHWAAFFGYPEVAHVLLAEGALVNAEDNKGYTPLHTAAAVGYESVVRGQYTPSISGR